MPFESYAHEAWVKHNKPKMYKKWVGKHGHYKGKKKKVGSNKYTGALAHA